MTNPLPGMKVNDPENNQKGVDTHYPKSTPPGPPYAEGGPPYQTNDNPSFGLASDVGSIAMIDQFTDWLMYQPPPNNNPNGGSQWVALANFSWATNGTASIPSGGWANYATQNGGSDAAQAVNPKQPTVSDPKTPTNFTAIAPANTFPTWTVVDVFPPF